MSDYPRPSMTADAVVLCGVGEEMKVLVIRRGQEPFAGDLALPGGFLDPYEHPLQAALRELEEETGLRLPISRGVPLSVRSKKGRDPRGWTVSHPYLFWLADAVPVKAGDDARAAFWQPISGLERLAFDHGAVLCEALGCFWEAMPTAAPLLQDIRAYGQPTVLPDSVTFFGGSFNPWHEGHMACVELCPDRAGLVVIPDTNPLKTGPSDECHWQRYRRLKEILPTAAVFPGFCGREAPNATISWLPYCGFPKKGLLLGDDSLVGFDNWLEAGELARVLNHIYVVPRDAPAQSVASAKRWFAMHNPTCTLTLLGDHPHRDVSSTALRSQSKTQ